MSLHTSDDDEIEILNPHGPIHTQSPKLGFIENADFIRLEDSDSEVEPKPTHSNGKKVTTTKRASANRPAGPRGTKRKFEASTITEEQANAVRSKKGSITTPWFDKIAWKRRNVQQMLTAEIGSFVAYIQPTHEEHQLRHMIIEMIRNVVQSKWTDADVEPFGSFGSKLYLPGGDIDLVVLSTQMMCQQKSKILNQVASLIRGNDIGHDVIVIAKAKVPIIKFKTVHGNINVDISINQTNGLVSLKKVNELLEDLKIKNQHPSHRYHPQRDHDRSYPHSTSDRRSSLDPITQEEESIRCVVEELGAAKCLILVIKSVLKQRGMNEVYTGGLGSYSIVCLVVSFLQMHPKVQRGDIDPNKNLGVLLIEFFELYGKCFNFDETGISVRKGGYYFSKAHRGWQRERQPYLLSIEDPADESNDISSNSHNIISVRTVFSGAFDLLTATLYHRHSLQISRSGARDKFSTSQPLLPIPTPKQKLLQKTGQTILNDPMDESLLGEIMGVTKELVELRKNNIDLFYSGTLQSLLQVPSPPRDIGSSQRLLTSKTTFVAAQDYSSSKHSPDSINADDSHRLIDLERVDCPPKPDDRVRTPRQEDELELNRKHLSAKDSNRQGLERDLHPPRAPHNRELVQYDGMETIASSGPKGKGPEKKRKRNNRKTKDRRSPAPMWMEDLEPSEVDILKRNLFTVDPENMAELNAEQEENDDDLELNTDRRDDDQVKLNTEQKDTDVFELNTGHEDDEGDDEEIDMLDDDEESVVQTARLSTGRTVGMNGGTESKKKDSISNYSDSSEAEPSCSKKVKSNGTNRIHEQDDQIDSRYQAIHSPKSSNSQGTRDLDADSDSPNYPSSRSSSGSKVFRQLAGLQQVDVKENHNSKSVAPEPRNISKSASPLPRIASKSVSPVTQNASQSASPQPSRNASKSAPSEPRMASKSVSPEPRNASKSASPEPRNEGQAEPRSALSEPQNEGQAGSRSVSPIITQNKGRSAQAGSRSVSPNTQDKGRSALPETRNEGQAGSRSVSPNTQNKAQAVSNEDQGNGTNIAENEIRGGAFLSTSNKIDAGIPVSPSTQNKGQVVSNGEPDQGNDTNVAENEINGEIILTTSIQIDATGPIVTDVQKEGVDEDDERMLESLPGTPDSLPGTPDGSPGDAEALQVNNNILLDPSLLDSLPGTPPSPPSSDK